MQLRFLGCAPCGVPLGMTGTRLGIPHVISTEVNVVNEVEKSYKSRDSHYIVKNSSAALGMTERRCAE